MTSAVLLALAAAAAASGRDTAGAFSAEVWRLVRARYPDAVLLSISGRTNPEGSVRCDRRSPWADGWRYRFHSRAAGATLLVGRCRDAVAGPFAEIRARARIPPPIEGKYLDNDYALRVLEGRGVSLDPAAHRGLRPFSFELFRTRDPRHAAHPVFWRAALGPNRYLINAETGELPSDARLREPVPPGEVSASTALPAGLLAQAPKRPPRPGGFTALSDFKKARRFAENRSPGAELVGIDGIVDAWGSALCTGGGDGWMYYFRRPGTGKIEAVSACRGDVGLARAEGAAADPKRHGPITGRFVDSDAAFDGLLEKRATLMNEGLGRNFTRTAVMRLRAFRETPAIPRGFSGVTVAFKERLLWEARVGSSVYHIDARTGNFLGEE